MAFKGVQVELMEWPLWGEGRIVLEVRVPLSKADLERVRRIEAAIRKVVEDVARREHA